MNVAFNGSLEIFEIMALFYGWGSGASTLLIWHQSLLGQS